MIPKGFFSVYSLFALGAIAPQASGAELTAVRPGDAVLRKQFQAETARLADQCLTEIRTTEDWRAQRGQMRAQLAEMLGLSPMPDRTELKPVVTGKTSHEEFVVENIHFQSQPGFYVTANLYLPSRIDGPLPTILYLCGHGPVITNGVSYGNKVAYQHHGAWFARHGYACLIVDSVQLGEILGLHHGTHRENLWWWNARGYTPAGAEAWNCLRALDYLATRSEIDTNRFGVTGRSGGGAYSWWIAALDDRIKVAAPVAGITDLQNHVVDGVVEGHCDCMFTVNTYRWDYPQVAALVAPRPLLIVNTDADTIFPLDGVQRVHARVREIYKLHNAADKLGLVIGPGPHKDTQDLQVPVFRWFNRHLKGADPAIETAALRLCTPEQLRVFHALPAEAINTNIHESFVAAAPPPRLPASPTEWEFQRRHWLAALTTKSFAGWPREARDARVRPLWSATQDGVRLDAAEFLAEEGLALRLYVAQASPDGKSRPLDGVVLTILGNARDDAGRRGDETDFSQWLGTLSAAFGEALQEERSVTPIDSAPSADRFASVRKELLSHRRALAWVAPRGIGLTAWTDTPKFRTQTRRRFMLLGQTLDGMRVWDIRRAVQALRAKDEWRALPLTLRSTGMSACNALYAALYEPGIGALELTRLPVSHRSGPDYLNVLRFLDVPQALAMAAERRTVTLRETDEAATNFARETMRHLGWSPDRLKAL